LRIRNLTVIAWFLAIISLVFLLVSAIMILLYPGGWDDRYLEILLGAIVGCGAPILGLVILKQQPRNRIGWLWLVYGLAMAMFSLSFALKYQANSTPPPGYSDPLFTMLIFSETASIIRLISVVLLILWFPDGQPPSRGWRFMHWWAAVALIFLTVQLFSVQVPWTEVQGVVGGAPTVPNPIGFLPDRLNPVFNILGAIGFFSIIGMSLLVVASIILRYRSAGQMVRAQIRWFVLGSIVYALIIVGFLVFLEFNELIAGVLGSLAILPFYLAIGIAITRYRLYDIDLFIRKTLAYAILTAALALLYLGLVTLLQSLSASVLGLQSPVIIVLSTLVIAALFNPLRVRIQNVIDRRFYRQKYDAEKALAKFAQAARNETDMECLNEALLEVVQETMEPETVSIWLKPYK
jgi:hypothetical protein